jgi:flavin reductase (DIM6/NTAB) family NADH-FMN oxidoreductase RutF
MDAAGFRKIMGHFATGITVVTTSVEEGKLHGMTANAVTSVSLDPLLLLVCVTRTSHAYDELLRASHFGINVLAEDQERLSRLFAERRPPEQGQLRGARYHLGPSGSPLLEGCLAYLECEIRERFHGGDHDIFLGEALHGDVSRDAPPLLYYRGGYRSLAP